METHCKSLTFPLVLLFIITFKLNIIRYEMRAVYILKLRTVFNILYDTEENLITNGNVCLFLFNTCLHEQLVLILLPSTFTF